MTPPKPPEPAAASQASEVDHGPVSAASLAQRGALEAQDAFARAEAEVTGAEAVKDECNAKVRVLEESAKAAQAEVDRFDALHELTAEQHLAKENARRLLRKLNEGTLPGHARRTRRRATLHRRLTSGRRRRSSPSTWLSSKSWMPTTSAMWWTRTRVSRRRARRSGRSCTNCGNSDQAATSIEA